MLPVKFLHSDKLTFVSITSEVRRTYVFPGGTKVVIEAPTHLSVTGNGHRVFDESGVSHYVPKGWVHLYWETRPNCPHYLF